MEEKKMNFLAAICFLIIVVLLIIIGVMAYNNYKLNESYDMIESISQNK